ncbi:hypothetical protein B484DRAFT_160093 [Ochromonadaceae sp. CCMP2298]|nr:hypothetical protein B484DRAFT_160093 [Ochromonadaceae sp. CCMP2298]
MNFIRRRIFSVQNARCLLSWGVSHFSPLPFPFCLSFCSSGLCCAHSTLSSVQSDVAAQFAHTQESQFVHMSSKQSVKLSAKWQLDAALLSRPVDLTALVTMSRATPDKFVEDNTLPRLVTSLLNEKNDKKSDKDTKLDVLNILANVATSADAVTEV